MIEETAEVEQDSGTPREIEHVAGKTVQLISFSVGKEAYCVDIMAVREIRAWTGTTTLPKTQDFVRGVINLRGIIVPIIDLRKRFGQGHTDPTKTHVVIILAIGDRLNGILADAVSDILTVPEDEIHAVPQAEGEAENPFIDGLVTKDKQMVALISLERLIDQAVVH